MSQTTTPKVLLTIDGLSAREIARRTGRSKDAVARSLRAARGRVAEMVA